MDRVEVFQSVAEYDCGTIKLYDYWSTMLNPSYHATWMVLVGIYDPGRIRN